MATQLKHVTSKNWFPIIGRVPIYAEHLNKVIDQVNTVLGGQFFDLGGIDCSANPNYPSMTRGQHYNVSVAGKIGGGAGPDVEAGDTIYCLTDSLGGTHAVVGTSYLISQVSIDPATLAELQAGTSVNTYVTPKTLKDQGITFGASTQTFTGIVGATTVSAATVSALVLNTGVAAAEITLSGSSIVADGTDVNIPIVVTPKGAAGLQLPAGLAATPAYTFQGQTDMGFYKSSASELGVTVSGTFVGRFSLARGFEANILNGVKIIKGQSAPVNSNIDPPDKAVMATSLLGGILTATPAAAINYTLPTGTEMQTAAGVIVVDNESFDFSIINIGAGGIITFVAAADFTIVGLTTVAANTSTIFRVRKTAANTFVAYRIS